MQRPALLTVTIASVAFASFIGGLHAQNTWFTDVPENHWAAQAIAYMQETGIMTGPANRPGMFAPNDPVNRAQLATVLHRMHLMDIEQFATMVSPSLYQNMVRQDASTAERVSEDDMKKQITDTLLNAGIDKIPLYKQYFLSQSLTAQSGVLPVLDVQKNVEVSNDQRRRSDVNTIVSAVMQYMVDHNGEVPAGISVGVPTDICKTGSTACQQSMANLAVLVPTYLTSLPVDPAATGTASTGYRIMQNDSGRIVVDAPLTQGSPITVER